MSQSGTLGGSGGGGGSSTPDSEGLYNLGMFYSSPTVTLSGADGNPLSASNPAVLVTQSNVNPGELVTVNITSDITFEDAGGTSIFADSLFGFTTGDDTAAGGGSDIPFYLYVSLDNTDANPVFWISRIPNNKVFLTTNCFDAASGSADAARNGLTVTSVTVGNYNNSNALLVGSFEASLNGLDDWVVEDVNSSAKDLGIGRFAEIVRNFPRGVMGARAGSYFVDNGGTAPTVNTGAAQFAYRIDPTGRFYWDISMSISGSPAGDVAARMIKPLHGFQGTTWTIIGDWAEEIAGNHVNRHLVGVHTNQNIGGQIQFLKMDGTLSLWTYSEWENDDILRVQIHYNL